jgi:hypothetical protein
VASFDIVGKRAQLHDGGGRSSRRLTANRDRGFA